MFTLLITVITTMREVGLSACLIALVCLCMLCPQILPSQPHNLFQCQAGRQFSRSDTAESCMPTFEVQCTQHDAFSAGFLCASEAAAVCKA